MIRRIAVLLFALIAAGAALADGHQTVLTTEGAVYTVDPSTRGELRLIRHIGEERTTITVPTTNDTARESDVKLVWDDASDSLFVMWHRTGDRIDQILLAQLQSDGTWSDVLPIASGGGAQHLGLEVVMTRAAIENGTATLIHAVWWRMNSEPEAEYALVAFENGKYASAIVTELVTLAGANVADGIDIEAMNQAVHPPLAMARAEGSSVDVVFGTVDSTRVTRVTLDPKVRVDARLWRPSRKGSKVTPRAGIQSVSGEPIRAMLHRGRIVLYTPETRFRFVIYDNGKWSPERMIALDENLTSEQLVLELRRTIEQLDEDDAPADVVE